MVNFWQGFNKQAGDLKGIFSEWEQVAEEGEAQAKKLRKKEVRVSPEELSQDHGPDAHQRYNP